jgi:GT2 family glycosyltransferase
VTATALNPPPVDVVVLSLDRLADTHECLDSVRGQDHPDVRLWVLDQGSGPPMIESLRARARDERFAFVEGGLTGVAAGRNRGYRMGAAPVIVALDNDAVLADPGVLTRAARRVGENPRLGALAFSVHDYSRGGPDLGNWGYPWPAASHFDCEFLTARFSGGGHAIARRAFEETDGYDERLFFFGEELDLSWQLIEAGYEIRYAPDLVVRHKSSPERRVDWAGGRFYFNVRNMIYLNRKYLPGGGRQGLYAAGYVLKGLRNGLAGEAIRGIRDGLRLSREKGARKPLGDAAQAYIQRHEYAPRGSAWRRIRLEIWPRLPHGRIR